MTLMNNGFMSFQFHKTQGDGASATFCHIASQPERGDGSSLALIVAYSKATPRALMAVSSSR